MKISTPTQAINSSVSATPGENLHESGASSAIWEGAGKKGKLGVFARLLEGLISRTKTGASESNTGTGKTGNLEFTGAGKTEKNQLKTVNPKKSFNLIAGGEGEPPISNADLAFLRQEPQINGKLQTEGGIKLKFGPNNVNKTQQNTELSQIEEITGLDLHHLEDSELISAINAGKDRNSGRNSGINRSDLSLWQSGKERVNASGKADVINVSFRDIEAKIGMSQALANQRNSGAEKENSKFSELRDRKNRINISVRDFRTGTDQAQAAAEAQKGQFAAAVKPVSAEIELPVNLNLSGGKGDGEASGKTIKEASVSKGFEDALARELRSGLANDIVRDATVILRNNNEGTIRLSLRPASLGDVKVRLEMAENKITGYIIVESSEALRAFERELPVLEKAFKDSGFSETNLEMSLAQDQWNFNTGEGRQEGDFPSVSPVLAASRYEPETEQIEGPSIQDGIAFSASTGRTPVNLLV